MRAFVVEEPRVGALRALNYAPAVERIRRAGSESARPLRELVKTFGPGWRRAFARLPCDPGHGVDFLSQSDAFAAEPRGQSIRMESMSDPARYRIDAGQILLAGTGTLGENELYGRALLADARLVGKYLTEDAMALVLEDPSDDLSLFAYAWLASPTGTQILRSTSYGTKLLRFRSDLLSTLPVPNAPKNIVRRVAAHIRACVAGREQYLRELHAARALVQGTHEMVLATAMCSERRRRSVLSTGPFPSLGAWNFASSAGAFDLLRKAWAGRLGDVVEPAGIFRGGRGQRIPCCPPHGIEFLSQRDAFLMRPVPQRVLLPSRGLIPKEGTILVGGQGTLGEGEIFGRASLVTEDGARQAWTEHLLRVVPKRGNEEALFAYLTTTVGFRLLRSTAVGTKLLSLRPDLLLELPIPDQSSSERDRVAGHVRSSIAARTAAARAESEAIRIIEEEVLPQWLA